MTMTPATIGLAACTAIMIVAAMVLMRVADDVRHPDEIDGPTIRVPRDYERAAVAYRHDPWTTRPLDPTIRVRLTRSDLAEFRQHLDNTAARRHWVPWNETPFSVRYVLPQTDVALLERIARDPVEWSQEGDRSGHSYEPAPRAEQLMSARLKWRTFQPANALEAGGWAATGLGSLLAVATLMNWWGTRSSRRSASGGSGAAAGSALRPANASGGSLGAAPPRRDQSGSSRTESGEERPQCPST